MSDIQGFLKKSEGLLGVTTEADIDALKDTLEALRKVSPDLIDSKIFERLSRLVDSVKIARDTQVKVANLSVEVKNLQSKLEKLTNSLHSLKTSFDSLDQNLTFNTESERQRNKKLGMVLEGLEQYLRRHT